MSIPFRRQSARLDPPLIKPSRLCPFMTHAPISISHCKMKQWQSRPAKAPPTLRRRGTLKLERRFSSFSFNLFPRHARNTGSCLTTGLRAPSADCATMYTSHSSYRKRPCPSHVYHHVPHPNGCNYCSTLSLVDSYPFYVSYHSVLVLPQCLDGSHCGLIDRPNHLFFAISFWT